jgi:CheY-like chemotaxis protein
VAKRVLIVDDDPDFVETTKIILEANGYETMTASSGEQALERVGRRKPDIILLDVMMRTKGDGVWTSQKLKGDERVRGVPVLMITAVNREPDVGIHLDPTQDGDYLPVDGFLEKPVEPEKLLAEIARLVGK